jgi:integrase/recombinase XerD
MLYQYVREPLTAEESDRLSNACETPGERLVVWTLPDTRLRVSELCGRTSKSVLWQQRQLCQRSLPRLLRETTLQALLLCIRINS